MSIEFLTSRGLVEQITNETNTAHHLSSPITFYFGIDPTSTSTSGGSLHTGHLLPILTARRLLTKGHRAIVVIGGATASIGDPAGRTDERKPLDRATIETNSLLIEQQVKDLLEDHLEQVTFVNNNEWFNSINFLKFVQEMGPCFSMNTLLKADSVASRLPRGMNFLEFTYPLMQAYDFLVLTRDHNCTLQIGGNDQWSNILGGKSLVHQKLNKDVFGMTVPLLVNSQGVKMGKTGSGSIFLDCNKTSVFDFFQFWRNVEDSSVKDLLLKLTDIDKNEIEQMDMTDAATINSWKERLAFEMTQLVHGKSEVLTTQAQVAKFFGKEAELEIGGEVRSQNSPISIVRLVYNLNFAFSNTAARKLIQSGGIRINGEKVTNESLMVTKEMFPTRFVVSKGKKTFAEVLFK